MPSASSPACAPAGARPFASRATSRFGYVVDRDRENGAAMAKYNRHERPRQARGLAKSIIGIAAAFVVSAPGDAVWHAMRHATAELLRC